VDNSRGWSVASHTVGIVSGRFLTLDEVADVLCVSRSQAYALVRDGSLPAMQIGGRRQWRVERARLEEWISAAHDETARRSAQQPP
jgi:excisionase family DNA binding protein